MNKELLKNAGLIGGGIAVGYGTAYIVTKKRLEKKFATELQREIDEVKDFYAAEAEKLKMVRKDGEFATVADATEALANKREPLTEEEAKEYNELLVDAGYSQETVSVTKTNIWTTPLSSLEPDERVEEPDAENEANWPGNPDDEDDVPEDDFEIIRDPNRPFIISVEEYMTDADDDDEYEKLSFGYYEEDGVLTDDRDKIIPDVEGIVGLVNLNHFGLHSGSRSTLYVRNERIKKDIEINREAGSYTETFLGKRFPSEPVSRSKRPRNDE